MIPLRSELTRILTAGNLAPSGENCQPWHFVVRGPTVEVHLLADRDQSAYSWGQRSSYMALGAAIENMVIAASVEHYRAPVRYFPDPENRFHAATVTFVSEPSREADPLVSVISERVSNRKPYAKEPLAEKDRAALIGAAGEGGELKLIEKREAIERLGRVGGTNEEVMLGNRDLHRFFFSHVNWTKQEDEEKKMGFYIKTLELPPPARAMFRLMKHWPVMRALKALGVPRAVAAQNAALNASAAAIGALLIEGTEPVDFMEAGRAMERVWLTATARGLSLQPLTGVLFFKLLIEHGEDPMFSPHERAVILAAYEDAADTFGAHGKHVAFMFRIGRGPGPSARAIRFPLDEAVTIV